MSNVVPFPTQAEISPAMTISLGDTILLEMEEGRMLIVPDLEIVHILLEEVLSVADTLRTFHGQLSAEKGMTPLGDDECDCPSCRPRHVQLATSSPPSNDN